MRLSLKFAGLIGIGATLVVLAMSVLSAQRDIRIIEQDVARDATLVAMVVARAIEHSGAGQSLIDVLDSLGLDGTQIRIEPQDGTAPATRINADDVVAVVPIQGQPTQGQPMQIVVRESLEPRDKIVQRSLYTTGATVISVLLLALGGSLYIGQRLVGRPVDALVAMARRVARGDYSRQVVVRGDDELGALSKELNLMAAQLEWARNQARAHAEARLQAKLQLLHADRLRTVGQLAAGLAHELGTPLNVISGRASLLRRTLKRLDVDGKDAEIIRAQAEFITTIVRRLMDFARPAPYAHDEVDLRQICEDTVRLLAPVAGGRRLGVHGDTEVPVHGAAEQLQQVVANLIMNAIHATDESGEICLRVEAGPTARLIIDDDGPGIPEAARDRVFEPFYTTKDPGEGTGLGLSIVHGLIEDHSGAIEVQAAPSGGARFVVSLPSEAPGPKNRGES